MSGKGKRRSARLLKLEEEKNDGDSGGVCLLDPWQIIRNSISGSSARGKRKRNGEIQVNCVGRHWVLPKFQLSSYVRRTLHVSFSWFSSAGRSFFSNCREKLHVATNSHQMHPIAVRFVFLLLPQLLRCCLQQSCEFFLMISFQITRQAKAQQGK